MGDEIISFRPSARQADLIKELKKLADKDKRSLNNYIEMVLANHVEQAKKHKK